MTEILKRHPIHHLTKNGQRRKNRYNETLVKLLNRCRTYLQVITIADMTNLDGITTSSLYLQGQRDPNGNFRWNCPIQQKKHKNTGKHGRG
jgi:hypothetical protein